MEKNRLLPCILRGILVLSFCGILMVSSEEEETFCKCEDFPIDGKPFVALWNAPTGGCLKNFSIPIELKDFEIIANPHQTWNGKYVVVFYNAQLGYYPYFTNADGTSNYNGGMPQLIDINAHLSQARKDIINRIPDPDFHGLAVIDWEGWRPIWDRNWGTKKIYQTRSIEILQSRHPDWTMEQLVAQARNQFENNAKRMMHETLKLGKFLRPKAKWGFYGFPDCYGHENTNYMCSDKHKYFNDKLHWMFSDSTALFPSIYLPQNSPSNAAFVRGRLLETLRVAAKNSVNGAPVPIFPYFRLIYEKNPLNYDFLTNVDLKNTIGQAAEVGAAGIVMWGNRRDENTSPEICHELNDYVQTTLGPYFKKVELESEKCSRKKCSGNGRCIKQNLAKHMNIYLNDIGRKTCPKISKQLTVQSQNETKNRTEQISNVKSTKFVSKVKESAKEGKSGVPKQQDASKAQLKNRTKTILQEGNNKIKNQGTAKETTERNNNTNTAKYELKDSIKDFVTSKSGTDMKQNVDGKHIHQKVNRTSSRSDIEVQPTEIPSETIYCNKTESGTTKCMLVKRHNSMKLSKHNGFQIPKIYAVLISISLGGAFVLSTVYIATYYYFNIFKKRRQDI